MNFDVLAISLGSEINITICAVDAFMTDRWGEFGGGAVWFGEPWQIELTWHFDSSRMKIMMLTWASKASYHELSSRDKRWKWTTRNKRGFDSILLIQIEKGWLNKSVGMAIPPSTPIHVLWGLWRNFDCRDRAAKQTTLPKSLVTAMGQDVSMVKVGKAASERLITITSKLTR